MAPSVRTGSEIRPCPASNGAFHSGSNVSASRAKSLPLTEATYRTPSLSSGAAHTLSPASKRAAFGSPVSASSAYTMPSSVPTKRVSIEPSLESAPSPAMMLSSVSNGKSHTGSPSSRLSANTSPVKAPK